MGVDYNLQEAEKLMGVYIIWIVFVVCVTWTGNKDHDLKTRIGYMAEGTPAMDHDL